MNWLNIKQWGKNVRRFNLNNVDSIRIEEEKIIIKFTNESPFTLYYETEDDAQKTFDRICNGATEISI